VSKKEYAVGNIKVCRKAFKEVFCVGNSRLARVNSKYNEDLKPDRGSKPRLLKTLVLTSWLKSFFETRVEMLPNKNVCHLPDNYSKYEVWKIYTSSLVDSDETCQFSYRSFMRIWKIDFPHVKIPPINRFSACADCVEFKTLRDKAITDVEKRKYSQFLNI
jgi:hypothetical protein